MSKRKKSHIDNKQKKKRKSSPQGVYWHFTEYDINWEPPVPYPEGTSEEEVKIRYLVFQLEVCPLTQRDHYQGYVQFYKKKYAKQVQNALSLSNTTHVELEKRDPPISINYVTKLETRKISTDQPFIYGIPNLVSCRGGKPKNITTWEEANAVYGEINKTAKTREEALEMIKEKAPRDLWCSFNNIKACAEYLYPDPVIQWVPEFIGYDWFVPKELTDWVQKESIKPRRAKCLILVGPTKWAKTEWARHLFPDSHMYFRNLFNLKKWDPTAKLIIFDDIEWEFIPSKKTLLTQMGEGELTDRYMKKQTVHVTMPALVLINVWPDLGKESKYWGENADIIELQYPLGLTPHVIENKICEKKLYHMILKKYVVPENLSIKDVFKLYNKHKLKPIRSQMEQDSEIEIEIESESEPKIIEISEDQKEDIIEYRRTHNLPKKMSNIEILERIEADKLLDNRAQQCIDYSKCLNTPSENLEDNSENLENSDDFDDMSDYPNYSEIQEDDFLEWERKRAFKIKDTRILTDDFINFSNDIYKLFTSFVI